MRRGQVSVDDIEEEPFYGNQDRDEPELPAWNSFKNTPREKKSGSAEESNLLDFSVKLLKIVTIGIVFLVVLGSAVVSKGTLLLMTSQINKTVTREYCNKYVDVNRHYIVELPNEERAIWMWMLIFAYCLPELGTFIRSVRICCFKSWKYPSRNEFIALFITESLPCFGNALLIFLILPELDVIKGAMLTNAVCFVPGILGFFSRNKIDKDYMWTAGLDLLAIVAQGTAFVAWPLVNNDRPELWAIPVAVICISVGWWENFISRKSPIPYFKVIADEKSEFKNKTYFMYIFVSLWKCVLFLGVTCMILGIREGNAGILFEKANVTFSNRDINITEIQPVIGATSIDYDQAVEGLHKGVANASLWTPFGVFLVNIICTYLCYVIGKFSCKVMIQNVSFALPINLTVPVLLSALVAMCGYYDKDVCYYIDTIPGYLFFNTLPLNDIQNFVGNEYSWIWLLWLLSQVWITLHIWTVNDKKLAPTEDLFMKPMYDAFLIDQSIALNRRHVTVEKIFRKESDVGFDNQDDDKVTRIFACATMWHETKDEMMEFLKSIFRLDGHQCAERIARNYYGYYIKTYYELETHIFFDDAFVRVSENDKDPHINEYVELLVNTMEDAAGEVHETKVKLRPPKIYPTPYGGRLVWTLPGKTKIVAHLKDAALIRKKKRWSQVMYMYYLLGHRIMENDELSPERIGEISKNTYILALDGDIDFKPEAVHLLVDYMKRNDGLGAACGRIHPIGEGAIAWYQVFEYAVGHWLQKATEHVIGCVLCSPGCFSLFRAKALMDNNVMATYTTKSEEARHYVQYDQGEDRWLCTLLLQRGYRVEYSAASDAYTHCPEGFNEFYNQRRRWMPSTMANILDLLFDSKHIVHVNDNISSIYIMYQIVLMIGTVIGPGTIFLMLVGSFVSAFKVSQMDSFIWNTVPIITFVVICACCKSDTQLFFAGIISGIYGLIMMAVLVGVMLQIKDDGFLAPSSLFFFCVIGEFIITAMLHPKEFYCLKYGIIYYVTVPSMYLLLVIYSVFNMNNVSWGTREVTISPKAQNQTKEKQPDTKQAEAKPNNSSMFSFFGDDKANAGSIEFSVANLFKCMWCTHRKDGQEVEKLQNIQTVLERIQQKLDYIERVQMNPDAIVEPRKSSSVLRRKTEATQNRTSFYKIQSNDTIVDSIMSGLIEENEYETSSTMSPSHDLQEKNWFYDVDVNMRAEVLYLDKREEKFWDDLIETYLKPIDDRDKKDKIAKDLKDLRDKMVMTFFAVNALFVLVIFLLTLQKDALHLDWPLDPKVNFTFSSINGLNTIVIEKEYLELEPIGFIFLICFGILMVVQFFAMLVHRFGTYSQIIANTQLEFGLCGNDKIENLTEEDIFEKDPVKVCRKLIKLKGINEEEGKEEHVTRRNTAHNLALRNREKRTNVYDLDKAFEIRLDRIKKAGKETKDLPKKTVAFMEERREFVKRRQSTKFVHHNKL